MTIKSDNSASIWILSILGTIVAGCMVSLFVWNVRSIVDSMQRLETIATRQLEGYRRAEVIEHKLESIEERIRQLELGHR
jgi:hypothetical protein